MPFTGTDEIHMRAPTCKYADSKSGFNDMVGIEIRYRQGNLAVFFIFGGGILPPSHGRRCPEGAEVGSYREMKAGIGFTELLPAEQPP